MELTFLNRLYGHAHLVRRYAGLPHVLPLPFTIQHGLILPGMFWSGTAELHALPNTIWAWSASSAASLEKFHDRVFIGGAPFVYLADELRSDFKDRERRGTLIFPPHGTDHVRLEFELQQYLDELVSLPEEFQPLTACLHPTELGSQFEAAIRARGIAIVSNGPSTSDIFLTTFISHAASAKYATAPEMCTAVAYCAYMSTQIFLLGPKVEYFNLTDTHVRPGGHSLGEVQDELGSRLTVEKVDDVETQRAIADDLLGSVFKLDPAEVRQKYKSSYRRIDVRRLMRLGTQKLARKPRT